MNDRAKSFVKEFLTQVPKAPGGHRTRPESLAYSS